MAGLAAKFMARLEGILKDEKVKFDKKVIAELIMRYAPDWRRVLNECQRYSSSGMIDTGVLSNLSDVNISALMKALKEKDFKTMRAWVVNNIDLEPAAIFRKVYDNAIDYAKPESVPQIVLILAEYQYKDAFVADHELYDRTDGQRTMEIIWPAHMWPNRNPARAYGTAECVQTDPTSFLTVGKQYDILDLDPCALSPTEALFDYLVLNDKEQYIWVTQHYFEKFIPRK
jgi:hypothetical protein